jgi:sodium/potassium-transporting ATPase subunit alpha
MTRKFTGVLNTAYTDLGSLLTIKGAPDVLIGRCSMFVDRDGVSKPLDEATRASISRMKDLWSSQGKRVILLARKTLCKDQIRSTPADARFEDEVMEHSRAGLTFVGIVGIVDPPRDEIPSVMSILRGAGIRIFMVSILKQDFGEQSTKAVCRSLETLR